MRRNACVIMDNTWATPLLFPPHERGVDIAVEAGTKYLSGGSDLLLGLTSANAQYWPALRRHLRPFRPLRRPGGHVPGSCAAFAPWPCACASTGAQGLEMARWFQARPEVLRVLHPGLPEDPGHAIWQRDFSGASGLFGVILKPVAEAGPRRDARRAGAVRHGLFLGRVREPRRSPSIAPAIAPRRTWAPGGPALRFHIGLEDVSDLKADLEAGFSRLAGTA